MTLEERIEAAALSLRPWPREAAERAIRAAFPELFTDLPQAWIAPWEASPEMIAAGDADDPLGGDVAVSYAAMRDAHLSERR